MCFTANFFQKKRRKTSKNIRDIKIPTKPLESPVNSLQKRLNTFFGGTNGFPSRWPNRSKIVKFDLPPVFRLLHREWRTTQIKQLSFFSSPGTYLWLIQKKKLRAKQKMWLEKNLHDMMGCSTDYYYVTSVSFSILNICI